jgi:TorA maturation chaperone TorD
VALALGFRPPTDDTLVRLASPDAAEALAEAAVAFDRTLAPYALALAVRDADRGRLADAHRRLFGHTARGEVPAYETEYGNEALFQQPQELSDLAGFAAAFGLALRAEVHERIDHVSCECELLALLAYKEAYALNSGDPAMCEVAARASALFLRDHLGRLAPTFARRVAAADSTGFYRAVAALLLAVVARDCRRLGVPLGAEGLGLRPDPTAVAAPMGCEQCELPSTG